MGLLDSIFGVYYTNQRYITRTIEEIHMKQFMNRESLTATVDYQWSVYMFTRIFYSLGFIRSPTKGPAFGNTAKYITPKIFNDTCIGLIVYFSLVYGVEKAGVKNTNELSENITNIFHTLDNSILARLIEEWSKVDVDELNEYLFDHFNSYGIFDEHYRKGVLTEHENKTWFINFLNQCYKQTLLIESSMR